VWEALLDRMPMTAMIRNLGKITAIGLVKPFSDATKHILRKLKDETAL
jgi:60 kDa SS-A/Ro ribonucleoprotein